MFRPNQDKKKVSCGTQEATGLPIGNNKSICDPILENIFWGTRVN